MTLDGEWRLQHFDDGQGEPAGAYLREHDDSAWLPARVPGQVHADLMAAGEIENPFFGLNYEKCLWVEEKEWWYRRAFTPKQAELPGRRVELRFEGLDTFATAFLNGRELGRSRNMWVPATFDVTGELKWDEPNTLVVRLQSPFEAVNGDMEADDTPDVNAFFSPNERLYARKAQMSFGWDISPRLLSVGIWRPVTLVSVPDIAIADFWAWTGSASGETALVRFQISLENLREEALEVACDLRGTCGESELTWADSLSVGPGCQRIEGSVEIDNPRLWWPHEMGEPNLYRGTLSVSVDGETVDARPVSLGVRTIELVTKCPETHENRFYFAVNRVPCFIRGTNWIPTDAMFARVTEDRLQRVLELCRECHGNMVRLWGGGIYEDPAFYRLCDEMGIMVWQDFMFACGLYPHSEDFLRQVRDEAAWVVKELRGHPCLALWAGDNENDCAYGWAGEGEGYLKNRITREVLPEVVSELDPTRPYIPSSPFNPSGRGDPQSPDEGDVHLWDHSVRPRQPMYFEDRSKFISEIGRICAANLSTTKRFLAPEDQWPHANKAWEHHVGTIPTSDFKRRQKTDLGVRNLIGRDAESLEEYIAASQYMQAWCLGEWIERARRRKFECGGILWWNIFDNWPQHVDAVVDYYFGKKVGFRAVQRASQPLLPSICRNGDVFGVWLLNDHLAPSSGMVTLSVADLASGTYIVHADHVSVEANTSAVVARIPAADLGELDHDGSYLHATYEPDDADPIENHHILDDAHDLAVFRAVYGPVAE